MAQLPSTKSIVDFLKGQKQDSSFGARRKLFQQSGLGDRLGSFVGSGEQNLALLNSLKQSQNAAPVDFIGPVRPEKEISGKIPLRQVRLEQPETGAGQALETATAPAATPEVSPPARGATSPAGEDFSAKSILSRAGVSDILGGGLTGIPDIKAPSGSDVLARARGETSVQIAEQEARIGKERIDTQLELDIKDLQADFASRGLSFSGAKTSGIRALRDQGLQDKLDIDITFAKILGNAIDRAQSELGKEIQEVIDDAKDQQKRELDFLKSVGLALDPETGELFPTLEAQRFQLSLLKEQRLIESEDLVIKTDAAGTVTALDKATGRVVWTKAGVGRAGSASPNISVTPISDPVTGQPDVVQIIDRDTGEVFYRDVKTGELVDPSQVQIDESADPLDILIDDIIRNTLQDFELETGQSGQ